MSACGRTHLLEPMVAGETPALEVELRSHAIACARCRHALAWLETEQALFRRRAGHDEVRHAMGALYPVAEGHSFGRAVRRVAASAAALLLVAVGAQAIRLTRSDSGSADASVVSAEAWSRSVERDSSEASQGDPGSVAMTFDFASADSLCSRLQPGFGFHCGPAVPASFIASR